MRIVVPKGWDVKSLGQIGESIIGLTYAPKHVVAEGGTQVLRSSNVQRGRIVLDDLVRVSSTIPERLLLKEGDILVCARNGSRKLIGKNARVNRANAGKTFGAFMCIYRSDHAPYIYWAFQSSWFRRQIARDLGPTINQVTTGNLNSFKLALPSDNEQRRIATVLEVWDEYLDKLDKKIKLKENIKKGLYQQLLRVPADQGQYLQLGDIGDTYAGLTGKTKEDFGDEGSPYVTYMNVYSNSAVDTSLLTQHVKLRDDEVQNEVKKGDILFTTSSETPYEVGISSVVMSEVKNLYLNSFCFGFRLKHPEQLSINFMKHFLRSYEFRRSMTRLAQGASRYNLSKRYFMQTKIRIPRSIERQEQIAHTLNAIDLSVANLRSKRSVLTSQRKYLLEHLITGKIRTPETLTPLPKEQTHA